MKQGELPRGLNDHEFTAFTTENGTRTAPVESRAELAYEHGPVSGPNATQHWAAVPVRTPHHDNAGGNGLI
ncbi:hypothetical protein [Mycobacteroides abscessus]|uniref:hypothetical protein n=1 Tax=Mycobacteroides abscessus TaxID=36809 RepID=UPI0013F4E96C|nr:hypothetical protein [Mycobacteroides abscessus]